MMYEIPMNAEAQAVLDELAQASPADADLTGDAVWIGQYRAQLHEFDWFRGSARQPIHAEQCPTPFQLKITLAFGVD